MKELKNNVNTLLWLMVTLSLLMMFSLVCLSSCKSSVQNGKGGEIPNPGPETVSLTFKLDKDKGSLKKDNLYVKVKRGNKIDDFIFDKEYPFIDGDEIQIEVKDIDLKEGESIYWELYSKEKTNDTNENVKAVIREGESKNKSFSLKIDSDLLNKANFLLDDSGNISNIKGFVFYPYIEDEMLKFLKEKIGFDRSYKHKRDVIYTTSGLGFGKKDSNELYYLTYGYNPNTNNRDPEYGNVVWTAEELKSRVNMDVPNLTSFIGSSLDIQWKSTKQYELEESTVETKYFSKSFKIADGYRFAIKINKENSALYILCSTSGWIYFADWQFVFVDKSDSNKGYTFRFGEYDENLKNGTRPYILVDYKGKYTKEKGYKYAPGLTGPMYCREAHEFRLSDIFQDTFNQKLKMSNISLSESQKNKLMNYFVNKLLNPSVFDAYIIVDAVFSDVDTGREYINTGHVNDVWKHVLKLTDSEFWDKCFDKKP